MDGVSLSLHPGEVGASALQPLVASALLTSAVAVVLHHMHAPLECAKATFSFLLFALNTLRELELCCLWCKMNYFE